ncbi:MAG: hypothetical protein ACXWXR_02080 [Candidatus Limnocylindrales bacterium]
MTHRYTLLVGGTVIPGRDEPDVTAIAWAEDTVIALGSDDKVRGVSRGDSLIIDLEGATVVPLGDGSDACWPVDATLEVGGRADLAVLRRDPRAGDAAGHELPAAAVVRGGRVVTGTLPGGARHRGHAVARSGS